MDNQLQIGIIGFGEAGFEFAKTLSNENCNVFVYDVILNQNSYDRASSIGITIEKNVEDLLSKTKYIFVFTSSSTCVNVASECAPFITENQIYIDCNTALPKIKKQAWEALNKHNKFVDLAVLGPVPGVGHKVYSAISGPGSLDLQDSFKSIGMNTIYVGTETGQAALIKLTRSTFMKGLAALLFETIAISQNYGVTDHVLNSLYETLGPEFGPLSKRLINGTFKHAERRVHEVSEVLELESDVGINGFMAEATYHVLSQVVSHNKLNDNVRNSNEIKRSNDQILQIFTSKQEN